MKNLKITTIISFALAILFSASCKKEYFTSVNVNTNAPIAASVTPAVLLTTVEGTLAYTQGGDLSRFASMFMQQTNGLYRQSAAYMTYIFTGQDVDQVWGNLYTSVMLNDVQLMAKADAASYNYYSGISRVLMAYTLMLTVDNFGSVPFSKAFGGIANLQPAYDVDKTLYGVILNLCDSAVYFLSASKKGALYPSSDDAIYGGDHGLWTEFAHAVKARAYIHQSKNTPAMATLALNEISNSFASTGESAIFNGFGGASNANNPWFQFNNQRGDISFATSTLADSLLSFADPRFPIMIDTTAADGYDYIGAYYGANPAAPVELITYEELQFMTAEATMTIGGTGALANAQTAFTNGITASMTKLGVASTDMATYLAARGTLTATTAMESIAWEEYVALYLNPEVWTLWRRTGLPTLTTAKAGANIPRRLLYPQTEYSYNKANTPANSTLYVPKIFWDN